MLTTKRRAFLRWLGAAAPSAAPADEHPTVPVRLTARVVARRVRDYLEGRWTRAQLSDWAACQFVRQDFSHWFEPSQSKVLREAVAALIVADVVSKADDTLRLSALVKALETER